MTLFDLTMISILAWVIAILMTACGAVGNAWSLRHPLDPPAPAPWDIREQLKRDAWQLVAGQLGMLLLGGLVGIAAAKVIEPANLQLGLWILLLTLAAAEGLLLLVFNRVHRPNAVTYWTLRRDIADALAARSRRHPSGESWTRLFSQAEERHFHPPVGRVHRRLGEQIAEILGELRGLPLDDFAPSARSRLDRWVGLRWMLTMHPRTLSSWIAPLLSLLAAGLAIVVLIGAGIADSAGSSWAWIPIAAMPVLSLLVVRSASRLRVLGFVRRAWLEDADREWCRERTHRLRAGRRPFPRWTARSLLSARSAAAA